MVPRGPPGSPSSGGEQGRRPAAQHAQLTAWTRRARYLPHRRFPSAGAPASSSSSPERGRLVAALGRHARRPCIVLRGWASESKITVEPTLDPGRSRPTEPSVMTSQPMISRRAPIGGGIAGLAGLSGLTLFPAQLLAEEPASDASVDLLKGRYQPVVRGPSRRSVVRQPRRRLDSTVPIYPVSGTPGNKEPTRPSATLRTVRRSLCAFHVPGGSIAMQFTARETPRSSPTASRRAPGRQSSRTLSRRPGSSRCLRRWRQPIPWSTSSYFLVLWMAPGGIEEYGFCFVSR